MATFQEIWSNYPNQTRIAVVISSAKLAKQVLKTQDLAICSRPKHFGQQKLSYNCKDVISSPYNSHWRDVRKIMVIKLLSTKKIQSFGPTREGEISRLMAKISTHFSSQQVVNLSEVAKVLASNLIFRSAFGKRYDDKESEKRRFDDLLHEAEDMGAAFFLSNYFPKLSWVDKLIGLINRLNTTYKNLDLFYQELIDEHLHLNEKVEEDILDALIKIKQENSDFTWDHVKALLMNIFVAGTDTSASSIVWTMTALMRSPGVMETLQQEIRSLIGKKGKVEEDDLPKLSYLKAVINESMFRCWFQEKKWKDAAMQILLEGKITVWFRSGRVGSGRRICPGMHMAVVNVELAIANLAYSFDSPGIPKEYVDTHVLPGITVHKKNPLLLVPNNYVI